jgi:hypothetical protein
MLNKLKLKLKQIKNKFIVLLIWILPANAVLTNCSRRHRVYVWLSMHTYWKIYLCMFSRAGYLRFAVWMYCNSLFLLVTLLTYVTRIPFHCITKIQDIKIRRGLCGHSVSFQMYMLVGKIWCEMYFNFLFQYPYRLALSCWTGYETPWISVHTKFLLLVWHMYNIVFV